MAQALSLSQRISLIIDLQMDTDFSEGSLYCSKEINGNFCKHCKMK